MSEPIDIVFDDDGELVALVLDAAPTEQHRATAIATEHEVERGVAISDHVRPERRTLTLEVVISDDPIRGNAAIGVSTVSVELKVEPPVKASVFQADTTPTRVVDAWRQLIDARDRALLATITTRFETYEDMVLIEVISNRTAADGSWLRAELTFAELRTVETQFVDDPVPSRPRDRRQVDRGSQEAQEAPPRLRSLAHRAIEAVGDLF